MQIGFSQPTIQGLFQNPYQYQIPPYQRGYAWEFRQVDDFWADIAGVGDGDHFLGPMVLHNPGGDEVRSVIDGQQRLTTLQILLALIRDKYIELDDPPRDPSISQARFSEAPNSLIRQVGYAQGFKLRAGDTNRVVLEDFILRQPGEEKRRSLSTRSHVEKLTRAQRGRNKALIEARNRLAEHLDKHLEKKSEPLHALRDLEDALVRRVTVVVLDLRDLNDAFMLFETLNDRGLRLSAADLLKSHLLSRLDQKHKDDPTTVDEAADDWDEMVDALGGGDISGYLRHYLLMRHERVKKSDVFPFFKKDVAKIGPDKTLTELSRMGKAYAQLVRPSDGDDKTYSTLTNLNQTSIDTHRVALLPAFDLLAPTRFLEFARVTEVLSFRWVVTGGNAQVLESIYQEAANILHESGGDQVDAAQGILISRVPSDQAFKDSFEAEELGYQYVAAYALRKIESAIKPFEKVIKPSGDVHVEHIAPKTSTEYWRGKITDGLDYAEAVQRWGNLTLLAKPLNESVGNGPWDIKQHGLQKADAKYPGYEGSDIELTHDLLNLDSWTSVDISLRAKWLAMLAVRIWSVEAALKGTADLSGLPLCYSDVRKDPTLVGLSRAEASAPPQPS